MYSPPPRRHARPPWWAWPTRLALDAPAVAVVWQRSLAAAHGVPVPVAASAVLGLVVWGVYLADRWLDAAPGRPAEPGDRHRFARRYRSLFAVVAGGCVLVAGVLAVAALPNGYLITGVGVASGVGLYLMAVHFGPQTGFVPGGKEFSVGALFAAGVSVPLLADPSLPLIDWFPSAGAFAALCWLNCGLIDRWEAPQARPRWRVALPVGTALALATCAKPPVFLAVTAAVTLLVVLNVVRRHVGPEARRVLADAALLTPLLLVLVGPPHTSPNRERGASSDPRSRFGLVVNKR